MEEDGVHSPYPSGAEEMLVDGSLAVAWVQLGEGWGGDYDPEDPNDEELLRFDALVRTANGWEDVEDGSYCTRTPVDTSPELRRQLLARLMEFLRDAIQFDENGAPTPYANRHVLEEASWIEPSWAETPSLP